MAILWTSWLPELNFIRLHYAWIIFCSLLAFPILYSYGNLTAIDALFFGCSSSTESGLNTVDVNNLKTYQQVYMYIIPMITNMMFINAMVVPFRLYWFRQRLQGVADAISRDDLRACEEASVPKNVGENNGCDVEQRDQALAASPDSRPDVARTTTIMFDDDAERSTQSKGATGSNQQISPKSLGAHNPSEVAQREIQEVQARGRAYGGARVTASYDDPDSISTLERSQTDTSRSRYLRSNQPARHAARSIERAATSAFVLGSPGLTQSRSRSRSRPRTIPSQAKTGDLPLLSRQVTIGRNSNFYNLSEEDRERLGGIEYRALRMLLKFVFGYFVGLHLFGVVCLLPWIHNAASRYTDWLAECGVGQTWWAIYSAQTMADNLGFTLTPDSMTTFKDATWPMLVMTFMAFAGNTCYPVFLRFFIWVFSKVVPKKSRTRETLEFLLEHPRRCYTLLFPSRPTWILFGIVFLLNFIDVVLIVTLDLDNPAVTDLPMGPRILSALFQAASARHTGTATLNLAEVNPAVQFSLLTMMYIAIFPIAISIRASNTDEERTLGIFASEGTVNEHNSMSYVMVHIRNQLTFDLWYIFLGTFLVSIVEADRIMDLGEPSFSLFPVLFEVTSAYGNVGLSLGGPFGATSMSGHYKPLSKFVICAMMIRGRHRGLPYALDRAITLPVDDANIPLSQSRPIKQA